MEAGEYRSHLLFSALPPARDDFSNTEADGINMKLNVLVSYSIPVFLSVGYETPQVLITDIEVKRRQDKNNKFADVLVNLQKTGNFHTYGKVKAYYKGENENSF